MKHRIGCLVSLAVSLCVVSPVVAVEGFDALRQDVTALTAIRDGTVKQLDERIAADRAKGPATLLSLELVGALAPAGAEDPDRRPISLSLHQVGGKLYAVECRIPKYNKAMHDADSSGLALNAGALSGDLRIRVQPDSWVPADGQTRSLVLTLAGTVSGSTVTGTVQVTGDYGSYPAALSGRSQPAPELKTATEQVTALPQASDDPAGLDTLVTFATRAYQELRAATLCLNHYPLAFDRALLGTVLPPPRWSKPDDPAMQAAALAYVRHLRDVAEGSTRPPAPASFVADSPPCEDPGFGRVWGDEALPAQDGVVLLPPDAGKTDGGQLWQFVGDWRLLAVFPPDPVRHLTTTALPEVLVAPGASYAPDLTHLEKTYKAPDGRAPEWTPASSILFQIPPPGQRFYPKTSLGHHHMTKGEYGVHGVTTGRWYAATMVRSEKDCELHAAVLANDFGKLWVNNRLVWMSRRLCEPYALVRIPLRKGDNSILIACENANEHSAIGLRLCVSGRPLNLEERKTLETKCTEATQALPPLSVRGRLGDWTSCYPDARPPLAWDLKQKINVRWQVPLPDYSCANPVIRGDRLYVNCEPHTLYCLNKDTGAILWKQDAHVFEFVPEAERAEALKSWTESITALSSKEVKEWDDQIGAAERQLQDDEDSKSLKEADRTALRQQVDEAKKQRSAFIQQRSSLSRKWRNKLDAEESGWGNNYGSTFGAPVADDRHVWVKYATGVAACFDRDGNRRWITHTRLSGGVGNISSPLLLRNTLIIQGKGTPAEDPAEWKTLCAPWPPFCDFAIVGLDAETGKIKWRTPVINTGAYGGATGISPLRLSNGKVTRELVVNGDGVVIDPEDGRLVSDCRGVGAGVWSGDPMVTGNRVSFYRGGGATIFEFWLEDNGRVGSRQVLKTDGGSGRAGLVNYRGRTWGNSGKGSSGRQMVPWHQLTCADTTTGKKVCTLFPALRDGGLDYAPPAAAGDYVVIVGNGTGPAGWSINPSASAEIGFVRCDPMPWLATACKVQDEAMTAAPVFEDGRMYLRTYRSVVCIEVKGEEGRRFEQRAKAVTTLESIAKRPLRSEARVIEPVAGYTVPEGLTAEPFNGHTAPHQWLFAGPFPLAKDDDPLAELGGVTKAKPTTGAAFSHAGASYRFSPLDPKFAEWSGGVTNDLFGRKIQRAKCTLDVSGAIERKAKTVSFFYAVLQTDTPRTAELTLTGGSGTEVWLSGTPIKVGETLRLQPGHYPVLVRVPVAVLPPFVTKMGVTLSFRELSDPDAAYREWLEDVRSKRERLDEIVRELPNTDEARTAASLVGFLSE